jgi:hypothetical protein
MPFSDSNNPLDSKWDDLFDNNIKPAVEKASLGYKCVRSLNPHGNFMRDVVNHLANAEIVIAILTELRPNVMYELGVRNALRRKTILLAEKGSVIPSDLSAFIALYYSTETKQGRDALVRVIQERLGILNSGEPESDSPVSDYLWKRAQDICDDWRDSKDPKILMSRIPEVLPSYAFQLGFLLNQISQHLSYSRIEKSIRESLASSSIINEVRVASRGHSSSEKEISEMMDSVTGEAMEAIKKGSYITVDTRPLLGAKGDVWQVPYNQFLPVSGFIDYVWFSLQPHMESMTYGITWALRDAKTGKVFKNAGRSWAAEHTDEAYDYRPMASVGIAPGLTLEAVPL